jgi:hypothetical protein
MCTAIKTNSTCLGLDLNGNGDGGRWDLVLEAVGRCRDALQRPRIERKRKEGVMEPQIFSPTMKKERVKICDDRLATTREEQLRVRVPNANQIATSAWLQVPKVRRQTLSLSRSVLCLPGVWRSVVPRAGLGGAR